MNQTFRRGVTVGAVALTAATLLGQSGSSAETVASTQTTMGPERRVDVQLSLADTGRAADSFKAATDICGGVLIKAILFHTPAELEFPACQIAVQVCAMQARANGEAALVRIYATYFDCGQ
jgi:hypothetical protein